LSSLDLGNSDDIVLLTKIIRIESEMDRIVT